MNEDGTPKPMKIGDEIQAEIANIDSQDRRISLSMRVGGVAISQAQKPEKRESRAPKRPASGSEEAKAGSIGELIKQKLGLQLGLDKDKKEDEKKEDEKKPDETP